MIFLLNIILISSCLLSISADYNYQNADEWANEYPQCGGSKQSPVDASFDDVSDDDVGSEPSKIKFEHIFTTVPKRMILKNDGHTLKLLFEWADNEKNLPYVTSDLFKRNYIVHSYEFRWSSDVNSGSEHLFGGKRFAMEMQVIHYSDEFDSYEEAENTPEGIVITSMIYKTGDKEFGFLTKLIEKFPEITEPGTETEIEPFAMGEFFEDDKKQFLVYGGSFTHPPCYESVIWLLCSKILPATADQIKAFQQLNLFNNDDHNNRPLQELDGRKFRYATS